MNGRRFGITAAIALWLAGVLQQSVSFRLAIFGIRPDFLLIVLTPLSLWLPRGRGAFIGFLCGLLQGAMAGANLAHYIISRSFAGFIGSWSKNIGFEVNALMVSITGAVLTLIAGLVWMFLAAPHGVLSFLGDTIGSAMYNGVLAIPVYMLLKRIVNPNALSGL